MISLGKLALPMAVAALLCQAGPPSLAGNTLSMSGLLAPAVSPTAPDSRTDLSAPTNSALALKRAGAFVAKAAVCTEDISRIKFQEYYVDWSDWMTTVSDRWCVMFNTQFSNAKFEAASAAYIQFTCDKDGNVSDVEIAKSSGDISCDQAQVEALKQCAPLPQFPPGSKKKAVTLMFVWDYGQKMRAHSPKQKRFVRNLDTERLSISGAAM